MTSQKNNSIKKPICSALLVKRMLLGGGIALGLIILFLSGVDNPDPEWGRFWMVRPLIVVPIAGAMGAGFFHVMDVMFQHGSWKKMLAIIIGLIVYVVSLWLGSVLGLDGTLWD